MDASLVCQICGEKLAFNPECPCTLGEHLIRKHPNVEMTHFSTEDLCCCSSSSKKLPPCPRTGLPCSCETFAKPKIQLTPKCVFKTTVETWKPGPLRVMCPQCANLDRPCIRRQRNRVAYSPLGALCLLVCWPVCFLPFLMPQSSQIQLFCKQCGAFLGEYDRKSGRMQCPPCPAKGQYSVNNLPPIC
ncbi:uncharacterized protein LOC109535911 [Dendroctonus ponderosae]|uniref:LITAF domain-containing protein n=1 Tax=Dendroctonus ponderosae TaxID=77166 RepID=A0AAR5P9F7_DENPD|nr:uncharacterized protein LOC109535911 [Dendroctonus ponderosae]KAH1002346.1 hypothetical protein HUJ04_008439 [Dendroctonus ponderosae]KAH1008329.1 hypothetical protein HUJ05_008891 [Dendroctonus ponderosae]